MPCKVPAFCLGNGSGEIGQDVEAPKIAGFGDCQKASRGELAIGATVAEADFSPLNAGAERSLGAVVGRLDAFLFEDDEPPIEGDCGPHRERAARTACPGIVPADPESAPSRQHREPIPVKIQAADDVYQPACYELRCAPCNYLTLNHQS